jgi:hypothetical protein
MIKRIKRKKKRFFFREAKQMPILSPAFEPFFTFKEGS